MQDDLFAPSRPAAHLSIEPIDRTVGKGLALLLADIANGERLETMRTNWTQHRYRGACPKIAKQYMEWKQ